MNLIIKKCLQIFISVAAFGFFWLADRNKIGEIPQARLERSQESMKPQQQFETSASDDKLGSKLAAVSQSVQVHDRRQERRHISACD